MTDTKQTPEGSSPADFTQNVARIKFLFLELANTMLAANLGVCGLTAEELAAAREYKRQGCQLGMEITASVSGAAIVALIAITPSGARHRLGVIESPPAISH